MIGHTDVITTINDVYGIVVVTVIITIVVKVGVGAGVGVGRSCNRESDANIMNIKDMKVNVSTTIKLLVLLLSQLT